MLRNSDDVLVFRSQAANRIDELYYKGMRLKRDAAAAAAAARAGTKKGARYRVLLTKRCKTAKTVIWSPALCHPKFRTIHSDLVSITSSK
jgi:hypothetical protein